MSRTLCILRTHQFGEQERRQLSFLRPFFEDNLIIVADETNGAFETEGFSCVGMDLERIHGWGIKPPPNAWAWQCGDLAFYAARKAYPDYDRYWIVEPDVWFHFAEAADFFAPLEKADQDLLTIRFEEAADTWKWYQLAQTHFGAAYRMLFPLLRMSGALIDECYLHRKRVNAVQRRAPRNPNDEALVGAVAGTNNYSVATFSELLQRKVFVEQILTEDILQSYPQNGRIYHPVYPPGQHLGIHKRRALRKIGPFCEAEFEAK